MPRRPRIATGGLAYHVLNRRIGRLRLFDKPADYQAFEKILEQACERTAIRLAAYCLMPNHWHLLLWPREDGELGSDVWITRMAKRLSLESTLRPRGRPRKNS